MPTRNRTVAAAAGLLAASSVMAGPPSFQPLGDLPGSGYFSQATSVSDDGRYVGGHSEGMLDGFTPIIWDGLSPQILSMPSGFNSGAYINDISGDGQSAVAIAPGSDGFRGIHWDASGTPTVLNSPPSTFSALIGIDYDGDTAGGFVNQSFFPKDELLIEANVRAASAVIGVTNDGSTFVGYGNDGQRVPVMWDQANGFQVLSSVPSGTGAGTATNIAVNGGTIVGSLGTNSSPQNPAYWDPAGIAHLINLNPGYTVGQAAATTADGSIIVGNWREDDFSDELGSLAFIWDEVNGARPLQDVLTNEFGIALGDWTLNTVTDITPDGRTLVGTGLNPDGNLEAYKVTIPAPGSLAVLALAGFAPRRRRRT